MSEDTGVGVATGRPPSSAASPARARLSKRSHKETHDVRRSVTVPRKVASESSARERGDECNARDSSAGRAVTHDCTFSRHDSIFSFGVSSARNAAELKALLGNSQSRLKPGAAVLSVQAPSTDKKSRESHAVSLEQAKSRARVEVDIALESDCCIEGGYMRGKVKICVRKRHKKEGPILLAEGKVRVIGFESISGEYDRHTFYQRASPLSTITDASAGICDSPPDEEGYSRPREGSHVLPFAMHLPMDDVLGIAKGAPVLASGATIRYIAMISIKVKDSITGKRSIAHFYRDCQVWPRMNPSVVLASAPRPIQASTAKGVSVLGNSGKLRLSATLHRLVWIAGQRCSVRIWVANETKKSVKSVHLTLVRTTTFFKPRPHLNPGQSKSLDPDACQTATTHKVVAETDLAPSDPASKGHASVEGWWTGVPAGQEAQFSHWVLIPPEALSVPRSRLIEVEYSIRVTVSAGPLTSDVHVALPLRIINFLSVDPTPSEPLLSSDGAYARLVPYDRQATRNDTTRDHSGTGDSSSRLTYIPSLGAPDPPASDPNARHARPVVQDPVRISLNTPRCDIASSPSRHLSATTPKSDRTDRRTKDVQNGADIPEPVSAAGSRITPSASCSPVSSLRANLGSPSVQGHHLGNFDLDDGAGSDEEVDFVVSTAQLDPRYFTDRTPHRRESCAEPTPSDLPYRRSKTAQREPSEASDSEAYAHQSHIDPTRASQLRSDHKSARSEQSSRARGRSSSRAAPSDTVPPECDASARETMANAERPSKIQGPRIPASGMTRSCRFSPAHIREGAGYDGSSPRARRSRSRSRPRPRVEEDDDDRGKALVGSKATITPCSRTSEEEDEDGQKASVDSRATTTPRPRTSLTRPRVEDEGQGGRKVPIDSRVTTTPRRRRTSPSRPRAYTTVLRGSVADLYAVDPRHADPDPPAVLEIEQDITANPDRDEVSDSGSQQRPSRQLPQPPPSDLPESVSALEALQSSHLYTATPQGAAVDAPVRAIPKPASIFRPTGNRSLPATPIRFTPTMPPRPASARPRPTHARQRAESLQPSYSSMAIPRRPTEGLRLVGRSECSVVQGRIAALEERLRNSYETGAAFV